MKQFDEITLAVAKKMDEKKARDIVLLDVHITSASVLSAASSTCRYASRLICFCSFRSMSNTS